MCFYVFIWWLDLVVQSAMQFLVHVKRNVPCFRDGIVASMCTVQPGSSH